MCYIDKFNLTNKTERPRLMITSTALSTKAYHSEQESGEIPSLMLCPYGDNKSATRYHLSE